MCCKIEEFMGKLGLNKQAKNSLLSQRQNMKFRECDTEEIMRGQENQGDRRTKTVY